MGFQTEDRQGGSYEVSQCPCVAQHWVDFVLPTSRWWGFFSVGKKDGSQCFVCDAMATNQLQKAARRAQLGTPENTLLSTAAFYYWTCRCFSVWELGHAP